MPFDNQVVELSSADLDKLFGSTPDAAPSADTLAVGKEADTKEVGNDNTPPTFQKTGTSSIESIPFYDDSLDDEVKVEDTPKEETKVEDTTKTPETIKSEEVVKDGEAEKVDTSSVDEVLTNTVEYLVKSGKWVDFEGREDLKITEEVYADLAAKQDEYRVTQLFNELLDSTGDYGKAIITHVKNGGNPDEIIDLFKEQKQLAQIDTSTEAGKQAKIEKYFKEILGWKDEKVEKTIKRLITDNEIDSEFNDVNDLYDKHYKEELAKTQEKVKQQEAEAKQRQTSFENNIKNVIKEDTSLTEADKRLIQSSVFDFKHKLPNGQKVNDFYIKFAEMQNDPKQYVDFVRWTMDRENYLKSITRAEETKANQKAFNFIKAGAALTKTKTSPIEINDNPAVKASKGTDFSFAIKK